MNSLPASTRSVQNTRTASLALLALFTALSANAQSVWTGTTNSTLSTGTNFSPNIGNTTVSNLNVQFNGTDATTTDITLAAAFGGLANGAGSAISVLAAQTNPLTITGSTGAAIRLNSTGLSVESGAGAVTFAGTGNINPGGLPSTTSHSISNQSSNTLDFGSWAFIAGGGGTRNLTVGGSGEITSNGNWSGTGMTLTKTGAGTLTLGGNNTYSGATTVNAGVLKLTHASALGGSALDTSGAGTVSVVGPTTLTIGGLAGSTNLASVITSGYSTVTDLTLNPGSGNQTYSGSIANGAAGMNLIKTGAGTQVLSGNNSYTGTTTVSAGTLRLGAANALGNGTNNTSSVAVNGSAIFDLAGISPTATVPLTMNSTANGSDVGSLHNSAGNTTATYAGAVTFQAATVMVGGGASVGGNITLTGAVTGNGKNLNKNGLGTLTFADSGTVTLGQLQANRGTIQVNSGTTLNVTSIVTGSGNSVGSGLTLNGGNVTSSGNATFGTAASGTASATLNLIGGTLTVPALTKGPRTFNANFNGGTLKASGDNASFFTAATLAKVQAGGALIDDGGFAITISQRLVHDTALDTPSVTLDGGLTKSGNGTLTLSSNNTYTGQTTINQGTLALGHATDTLADSGAVTISGGTLAIGANSDTVGVVTLTNGSITGSTGVLTGSAYNVESGTISAILGGSGALTKSTGGTVTLSATNTYTGNTTINGGTLQVDGALGATAVTVNGGTLKVGATGSVTSATISVNGGSFDATALVGGYTVGSGQTISGTGTYDGDVTIGAGGNLAPGNSPGVTTFSGDLTLAGTTTLEVNGTIRGTQHDGINLTGLSNALVYGGTLSMSFNAVPTANVYDLFQIAGTVSQSGTFGTISIGGTAVASSTAASITGLGWSATFTDNVTSAVWNLVFNNATGDLTITAIPEPSTYAFLAGFGVLGLAASRRRRKTSALN